MHFFCIYCFLVYIYLCKLINTMQNKHVLNYIESGIQQVNDLTFCDLASVRTLLSFIQEGGCLGIGLEVYMERNYRTQLESGFILDWKMAELTEEQNRNDLRGAIKNSNSFAFVYSYKTQRVEQWPFTMLYIQS